MIVQLTCASQERKKKSGKQTCDWLSLIYFHVTPKENGGDGGSSMT